MSEKWLLEFLKETSEPQAILFIDGLDIIGTKKAMRNLDDFFDLPTVLMIDVNKNPKVAEKFGVTEYPTILTSGFEPLRYVGTEYKPMMGVVLSMVEARKALQRSLDLRGE